MSINYQFGDVDAHGATIRAQAASLEAEHQSIVRDVLAAGDFWGGAGSVACQEFITQLGRNFQVIYEQANAHGQKVQTAGNNMNSPDNAVGSSWAELAQGPRPAIIAIQHRSVLAKNRVSCVRWSMGDGAVLPDHGAPVRAESVHEGPRARVERLYLPGGT